MKPVSTDHTTNNLSLQPSQHLAIFNDINRELKRGGIVLTLTTTESDWIPSQADDDYRLDPVKVGEFVTAYMQALEARQNGFTAEHEKLSARKQALKDELERLHVYTKEEKRVIDGAYHEACRANKNIPLNEQRHDKQNREGNFKKAQADYQSKETVKSRRQKNEQEMAGIVSQIKQLESKHITPQQKQTLEHDFRLALEKKRIEANKTPEEPQIMTSNKSRRTGKNIIVTAASVAGLVSAVFLGLKNQEGSQNIKTPQLSQAPTSKDLSPEERILGGVLIDIIENETSALLKTLRETGDVAHYKSNLQNALLEASKKAGALGKVEVFEKMDGDPPQKATFFRVYAHENLAPVGIVRQKEITTCIELYIMKLYKEKNLARDVGSAITTARYLPDQGKELVFQTLKRDTIVGSIGSILNEKGYPLNIDGIDILEPFSPEPQIRISYLFDGGVYNCIFPVNVTKQE